MKHLKLAALISGAMLAMTGTAYAKTDMTFGGYIKADVMFSDYGNGAPDSGSLSRQFYVPGTIYGEKGNGKQVVDFQARESRFNFKTVTDLEGGHSLTGFIELDFMTHTDGNERVSNSYSPRIRHAFVTYDNWTIGQTWTTFQNPGALPENLDFVGAADGTPFVRQALIKYTSGNFQIALENPETTLTPNNTGGARITSGSGVVPDVIARYNFSQEGGAAYSLAAIVRQLNVEELQGTTQLDSTDVGYGVSFAGVIPVGKDDFKFTATYGEGLGRYMALNYANAGVLDSNNEIQTITSYGGFVSYRHWWSEQWRSSFTLSGFSADNDVNLTGGSVNKEAYSGYVNLLYSPSKPLTFGVEYMHALNEREDGVDGDLNRIMFSAKYVL
ncbi:MULTISPECIES: DcaP family trimeric outer membrane transporter [Shewanella]|uniref:DcaP family trimeric outer membrane transporter n=1 Tax=Shewanella holmiensis TaxID=2952222 RepID=A0A9X2WMW8_9GAMM|nr:MULTISPECIES: DcaP family trimeric outer membrane transporter [Shewanella]MCT7942119.1 DcaP family trimeric outer membrane transporter [Shewanella holmiensis]MDP5145604.1 DcaP family trimeric outer membrane transporter [Shewanella sp. ULN5]